MQSGTKKPVRLSYVVEHPCGDTKRVRDFHANCASLALVDKASPYQKREPARYTKKGDTCERCGEALS